MSTRQAESRANFRTPWGEGVVRIRAGRLSGVVLPPLGREEALGVDFAESDSDGDAMAHWVTELERYFRGERVSWTVEDLRSVDLPVGKFARRVYEELLRVPAGTTVSYGELAEKAGHPRAARAVGTAMARNPVPLVIPCHRVIRSDGSLGRYGSDSAWKRRLLEHERSCTDGSGR